MLVFTPPNSSPIHDCSYRLAPEHRYPAAVDDCEAVVEYVLENATQLDINKSRVIVMGDSAGGALSTIVARRVCEKGKHTLAVSIKSVSMSSTHPQFRHKS